MRERKKSQLQNDAGRAKSSAGTKRRRVVRLIYLHCGIIIARPARVARRPAEMILRA